MSPVFSLFLQRSGYVSLLKRSITFQNFFRLDFLIFQKSFKLNILLLNYDWMVKVTIFRPNIIILTIVLLSLTSLADEANRYQNLFDCYSGLRLSSREHLLTVRVQPGQSRDLERQEMYVLTPKNILKIELHVPYDQSYIKREVQKVYRSADPQFFSDECIDINPAISGLEDHWCSYGLWLSDKAGKKHDFIAGHTTRNDKALAPFRRASFSGSKSNDGALKVIKDSIAIDIRGTFEDMTRNLKKAKKLSNKTYDACYAIGDDELKTYLQDHADLFEKLPRTVPPGGGRGTSDGHG